MYVTYNLRYADLSDRYRLSDSPLLTLLVFMDVEFLSAYVKQ